MDYFENENIPEELRLDIAFQIITGLRETINLAEQPAQTVSYELAFSYLKQVSPSTYESITKLYSKKNESDLVLMYKERAEAKSRVLGKEIQPEDLIDDDINELVIEANAATIGRRGRIDRRINELNLAKENLKPRDLTEDRILHYDFSLKERHWILAKLEKEDVDYKDFQLPGSRSLRIRLLHPEHSEKVTGADLLYEQFNLETNKVRFVALQYKVWKDGTLYLSSAANLEDQIKKLEEHFCEREFCFSENRSKVSSEYRLPFCSTFLRPTDKKQRPNSRLVSSGYHLPICSAKRMLHEDGKVTKNGIRNKSIHSRIFEQLFISEMLGSRWLAIEELYSYYEEIGLLKNPESIRLQAIEVIHKAETYKAVSPMSFDDVPF